MSDERMTDEQIQNLRVGDTYENDEGDRGTLKFGLYYDSEGAFDVDHLGWYLEYKEEGGHGTYKMPITTAIAIGFKLVERGV